MTIFDQRLMAIFSMELFSQISAGEGISLCKYNLFTNMLIKNCIPFDTEYEPGNRKDAPAIELTIHINPSATLVIVIALASGGNVFESD